MRYLKSLKNMVPMTYNSSKNRFFESHIYKNNMFPGCSHNFLVFFEAFWYNKMNKYGLPELRKSRNHQIWRF